MTPSPLAISLFFCRLRDPRLKHRTRHLLIDIIVITLCAVIAGANDWQDVHIFATQRQEWLATFLNLPNGIPSHDTFERVFSRIDPQAFLACFQQWVDTLTKGLGLKHIAIDGKTAKHSGSPTNGWKALHLVSAWAGECHLSLGQVATEEKSNEITAIPELLKLLDIKGALVTIDAMGCQKEIAKTIVAGGGDYVLTVKDNQPRLLEDIESTFTKALDKDFEGFTFDTYETHDKGHGREEKRSYTILTNLEDIRDRVLWKNLSVIGMCLRERTINGETSGEVSYFIGSRPASAGVYGGCLRGHWGIENNLNWQLDVSFGEDGNRVQNTKGRENLALIRRMALSILKRYAGKSSLKGKRYAATLSVEILEEILLKGGNMATL